MVSRPLDALALAALNDDALISRIAAFYLRFRGEETGRVVVESREAIVEWVRAQFGDLLPKNKSATNDLYAEVRRQSLTRERRRRLLDAVNQQDLSGGSPNARRRRLARAVLGPPRRWGLVPAWPAPYLDVVVNSGLIAALLETRMTQFRRAKLLVYKIRGDEPRSYWIPAAIGSVAEALGWLIPPEVRPFLELPGATVEHDGRNQAVRLTTTFGTKLVPWRSLATEQVTDQRECIE